MLNCFTGPALRLSKVAWHSVNNDSTVKEYRLHCKTLQALIEIRSKRQCRPCRGVDRIHSSFVFQNNTFFESKTLLRNARSVRQQIERFCIGRTKGVGAVIQLEHFRLSAADILACQCQRLCLRGWNWRTIGNDKHCDCPPRCGVCISNLNLRFDAFAGSGFG